MSTKVQSKPQLTNKPQSNASQDLAIHQDRQQDKFGTRIILFIFFGSTLYATFRYNIFKGVPWTDWPLYVLNKSFAVSALILLVLAIFRYRNNQPKSNKQILNASKFFLILHILISTSLLSPVYYAKFFADAKLTLPVSISILLGAIATALYIRNSFSTGLEERHNEKIKYLTSISLFVGFHAGIQGYQGWFSPNTWPGFLPPITLISFLLGISALLIRLLSKNKLKTS